MSIGQTPNHTKFCGNPTRNVRDIYNRKFVLPKVVQNSPKSLFAPKAPIMPNFIEISETTVEKALQMFYTLQYFGSSGGPPWPKVTDLGGGVHQPPLATSKISSNDPSLRYLLPNLVNFVAGPQ